MRLPHGGDVAAERLGHPQQVVAVTDRQRRLVVGVGRHQHLGVPAGPAEQHRLQPGRLLQEVQAPVPQPQRRRGRLQVVAGPGGVQHSRRSRHRAARSGTPRTSGRSRAAPAGRAAAGTRCRAARRCTPAAAGRPRRSIRPQLGQHHQVRLVDGGQLPQLGRQLGRGRFAVEDPPGPDADLGGQPPHVLRRSPDARQQPVAAEHLGVGAPLPVVAGPQSLRKARIRHRHRLGRQLCSPAGRWPATTRRRRRCPGSGSPRPAASPRSARPGWPPPTSGQPGRRPRRTARRTARAGGAAAGWPGRPRPARTSARCRRSGGRGWPAARSSPCRAARGGRRQARTARCRGCPPRSPGSPAVPRAGCRPCRTSSRRNRPGRPRSRPGRGIPAAARRPPRRTGDCPDWQYCSGQNVAG